MKTKPTQLQQNCGFTLIEVFAGIAIVGIISAVLLSVISGTSSNLKQSKLEQDVSRLNTAVKLYTSNGGSLEGVTTAQDVINELKKEANADGQERVVGLRGSMVDNRLEAVLETNAVPRERAVWNSAEKRFVIETSSTGVREFRLNEALASVNYADAERLTRLVYNNVDGWIWETTDFTSVSNSGPSSLPTISAPTLGASGGSGAGNSSKLGTPTISPDSGIHPLSTFPLLVSITKDSADPPDAKIFYSSAPNVWSIYSAPFVVEVGTSIQAYSSNEDPDWDDSDFATASFHTDPEALEIAINTPRNPITYVEAGGAIEPGGYTPVESIPSIMVTLPGGESIPDIYEDSSQFQFYWTYDGSNPLSSPTRVEGIKFVNGYKNKGNNGHGNNTSGTDVSNPAYIKWAEENGVDLTGVVDDEMKPFDTIKYTMVEWDGATLLPIRVVAQSKNPPIVINSAVMSSNIGIKRITLQPPGITFVDDPERGDTVELTKYVDFGDMPIGARIYYTTDGTDPGYDADGNPQSGTLYTGPFDPLLGEGEFVGEAMIVARVYAPEEYTHWFNVSVPSNSHYVVPTWDLTGVATAGFLDSAGELDDSFYDSGSGSWFAWTGSAPDGQSFTDISNRERFGVGQLAFYNGTGYSIGDLGAVDFAVQLDIGGTVSQFDYSIERFTTLNDGNEWENADFIWFNDTESSQKVSLYGVDYSLNLEFGESTTNGNTTAAQFQVQEGETAIANLYGTLISVASWW